MQPRLAQPPPVPPDPVLRARDRFVAWLRWYIATHQESAPTSAALARQMGVTKPAVHRLLEPGSHRVPSLETILAAEQLLGFPCNVLLHSDPPAIPVRRPDPAR
jgi:hypothetical protein